MNEIEAVRRFRAETGTHDEREVRRARGVLLEEITRGREHDSDVRERLRRAPRRTIAIALAVVVLPGSYAIADSAGVFDEPGTVTLTPETATPAPAPGSESEPPATAPATGDLAPDPSIGDSGDAPGPGSVEWDARLGGRGLQQGLQDDFTERRPRR